ncbi:MAG: gamma-glutamylcyclotransferase [Deltaproteobacteria bacterium]|nr:gamma-glutamylcyclotransferase [Deltaproteobacteria bacterium]
MKYFAFGSNLNLGQMRSRCPDAVPLERALLRDHRLAFRSRNGGHGVATVVRARGWNVRGGLYRISNRDLMALDNYEGWPISYSRATVEVVGEVSGPVGAIIYWLNPPHADAPPNHWYREAIVEGLTDWGIRVPSMLARFEREVEREEA